MDFEHHSLLPALNPAYAPIWHPAIVADMAELITHPDVQWNDIEALLAELPQERAYVRALRTTQMGRALPQFFFGQSPSTVFTLDADVREVLLSHIMPYAILLDNKLSPLEQAARLRDTGMDVENFCLRVQPFYPIYADAARAALQAWKNHSSLLRGSERAPEPTDELLRSSRETEADTATLLQASDPTATEPAPAQRGLLHRLFRKS